MMGVDWSVSPALIWYGAVLLGLVVIAAVAIEVADWGDHHHKWFDKHFGNFFH